MSSNKPLSKSERREAARAQALALKQKQEAADRRARLITLSVLGAVLAALVAVVVVLFVRDHQQTTASRVDTEDIPLSEVTTVPAGALPDGGIPIGTDRAAGGPQAEGVPTVGIYFDYMCPICGEFERLNLETIETFIAQGTANVVLYPVAILDHASRDTQFSTRSVAAFAWVADRAPEHALDFHITMFENEPAEGTPGHSNAEMADLARGAGVPEDVAAGIESGEAARTFGQWAFSATRAATGNAALANPQTGGFGTPTVTLDGERWGGNWREPGVLAQAVADAAE